MALPANISTRWVEGQFLTNVNDGPDPDRRPDSIPAQGVVTFVAAVPYLPDATAEPNPATLLMIPRIAVLDEAGYICTPVRGTMTPAYRGIMLECTDDPDGSVTGWTWNVKYAFKPIDGVTPVIDSHSFPLPMAEEALDLTTVVKVPSSVGIGKEQAEVLAASAQAAAQSAALNVIDARAAATTASLAATRASEDAAVAREVERRANAGEFKGDKGDTGPQGSFRVSNAAGRAFYAWDATANRDQLIYGDTGLRQVTLPVAGLGFLRRVGQEVSFYFRDAVTPTGAEAIFTLPPGFTPDYSPQYGFVGRTGGRALATFTIGSGVVTQGTAHTTTLYAQMKFTTSDPWPTSLPGTAVGVIPNS